MSSQVKPAYIFIEQNHKLASTTSLLFFDPQQYHRLGFAYLTFLYNYLSYVNVITPTL